MAAAVHCFQSWNKLHQPLISKLNANIFVFEFSFMTGPGAYTPVKDHLSRGARSVSTWNVPLDSTFLTALSTPC